MANEKRQELTTEQAKQVALRLVADGASVRDAMLKAGRSYKQWEYWKRSDEGFKAQFDALRNQQKFAKSAGSRADVVGGFEEFSKEFLNTEVFPHQLNVVDLLEGREPSWVHPSMKYAKGLPGYVMVNMPPEHAKSMTVTINYATYRICKDPNVRIMLVSKTKDQAKEFLYAVKQRLAHPRWQKLQLAYGPPGGFKSDTAIWQADKVYIGGESRDSDEKDPTVEALGIGGQIYGARADLIILDDVVTLSNAHEYEKQIRWIQQEVLTRLGPEGKLLVLGTRVDNVDLYSEITKADRYMEGEDSPWTLLRMPAVLEFADRVEDWRTLWPKAAAPWSPTSADKPDEDGYFPRWDGKHLKTRRGVLDPKTWAMVYQQQDVSEDAIFDANLVRKAVNGQRRVGLLKHDTPGHPRRGMEVMWVVCSLDPAIAGDAGAVALAVDRQSKMRYVLDARVMSSPTPAGIRGLIQEFTETYSPNEWRIEKNSFQRFLTQDEALRDYLTSRGIPLREVFTGSQKWDVEWGVASMAPLFGWQELTEQGRPTDVGGRQIEFPSTSGQEGIKALIEQLITWAPKTKNKQDMVMALWFAEVAAREQVNTRGLGGKSHVPNGFLSPERAARRVVIDLNEAWEARNRITA